MSIAAVVMLTSIQYIEKIIEVIPKHSIKHILEIFLPILITEPSASSLASVTAALLAITSISGE